jgi:RNA-directed DNA polymerase
MTRTPACSGASSTPGSWSAVDWRQAQRSVFRLQLRIAKAARAKRWGKVQALQRLLTRSHHAKLLAVKRVTSNAGKNTPGVDGVVWKSAKEKWKAAQALSCQGYRSQPLRRIYIPKRDGKNRPLGIPTMYDRALQALFLLAVEPVAEVTADLHSYGFRPKRSAADAIERSFVVLAQRTSAQWILEGDIKGCFDNISHSWMLKHLPLEKRILEQWLSAGYLDKGQLFPTPKGTPQGGIISPCMMNMVLDGMEAMLSRITKAADKVHLVRYADDFIVTGSSKQVLENTVKPAISAFLLERGLTLSEEKTAVVSIEQGFDFLGFNVRKYNNKKLLIKPSVISVRSFLTHLKGVIRKGISTPTIQLIRSLNQKIRGWVNFYRHVVAKQTFSWVDSDIFWAIYRMLRRKHPRKSATWVYRKYYIQRGMRRWLFHASYVGKDGVHSSLLLATASRTPIRRHRQIRSAATPYDVEFLRYFDQRQKHFSSLLKAAGSIDHGLTVA